jgi:hypothetical protein
VGTSPFEREETLAKGTVMTIFKREIYPGAGVPSREKVECWRLVFDTEAKRLLVEHRTTRMSDGGRAWSTRTEEISLSTYLSQQPETGGHRELLQILRGLLDANVAGQATS